MPLNKTEKLAFIGELTASVTALIVSRVDDMPEDWDGIELRRYISDKFAESVVVLAPGRIRNDGQTNRRWKAYRNEVLTRNL